ncbi:acyl-CoA carboxylase epsilon subunit [Streptomyces olivoreticuli]
MSGGESVLRVVRGNPDAAELAAVVTVVLAAGAAGTDAVAEPLRPLAPWVRPTGAAVGWSARLSAAWRSVP